MAVKGSKKDTEESNFETAADNEKVSIDSMLFPKATVHKVSKQILSQSETSMILAKDSQTVIQRGSVLFVNYVYHHAKQVAKDQGRKVVNANDILAGLERAQFGSFVPVLNEELEKFNLRKENKKKKKDELEEPEEAAETNDDDGEHKRAKVDATQPVEPAPVPVSAPERENETTDDVVEIEDDTEEEQPEEPELPAVNAIQNIQQEMKELEGEEPETENET